MIYYAGDLDQAQVHRIGKCLQRWRICIKKKLPDTCFKGGWCEFPSQQEFRALEQCHLCKKGLSSVYVCHLCIAVSVDVELELVAGSQANSRRPASHILLHLKQNADINGSESFELEKSEAEKGIERTSKNQESSRIVKHMQTSCNISIQTCSA